jgi:hypothetical protein
MYTKEELSFKKLKVNSLVLFVWYKCYSYSTVFERERDKSTGRWGWGWWGVVGVGVVVGVELQHFFTRIVDLTTIAFLKIS